MTARQTVEAYFEALTSGDAEALIQMISSADHLIKIGTDEGEVVHGGDKATEYYRLHVTSTEDFTIDIEHLDVQEREAVAWFFTEQTWRLKWQGKPETLAMRMTGVLERDQTDWKFVQIHASIGVPT